MAEPFLSEIRIMSFGFAPKGWAQCAGQTMPINQNQALFSLLGTTYGGDGRVTFGIPALQGRAPLHMGAGHTLGERGGEQNHTLTISEIPTHVHTAFGNPTAVGGTANPVNNFLGGGTNVYNTAQNLTSLEPSTVQPVGGSQPPPNMQPFLVLNFCIALQGIFPSQN